jgi:hypothetical protein
MTCYGEGGGHEARACLGSAELRAMTGSDRPTTHGLDRSRSSVRALADVPLGRPFDLGSAAIGDAA